MKKTLTLAVLLLAAALAPCRADVPNVIIDTDMSTDCDDVGAVCILNALADQNKANIVAIVHNTGIPQGIAAVSVLNTYYGRQNVSLGAYKGSFDADVPGNYVPDLVEHFPSPIKNFSQVPDAVTVYRKALAQAANGSITISSIGFTTNLEALLKSGPDAISPMNGVELVRAKVKLMAWMGGMYPASQDGHGEWNFSHNGIGTSTKYVNDNWPTEVPIMFSGWELGSVVETGGVMTNSTPASNPCRKAYIDYNGPGKNRSSWDPVTTLFAVRGFDDGLFQPSVEGWNNITVNGTNSWVTQNGTNRFYLIRKASLDAVEKALDDLMIQPPNNSQ